MDVKVTVNVELGPNTLALLSNGFSPSVAKAPKQEEKAEEAQPAEKPKTTRTRASKPKEEAAEAPVKKEAEAFEDMDDDAKLEAIKAEVTKHTKKGKSADIKALLGGFDAARASELAPEDLESFYDAVKRYGAGETVDDILDDILG